MRPHAPHGTNGGYIRHIKAGETPCEYCTAAHRHYQADYRDRRRWNGGRLR